MYQEQTRENQMVRRTINPTNDLYQFVDGLSELGEVSKKSVVLSSSILKKHSFSAILLVSTGPSEKVDEISLIVKSGT